jgi:hypothetical protein
MADAKADQRVDPLQDTRMAIAMPAAPICKREKSARSSRRNGVGRQVQ